MCYKAEYHYLCVTSHNYYGASIITMYSAYCHEYTVLGLFLFPATTASVSMCSISIGAAFEADYKDIRPLSILAGRQFTEKYKKFF